MAQKQNKKYVDNGSQTDRIIIIFVGVLLVITSTFITHITEDKTENIIDEKPINLCASSEQKTDSISSINQAIIYHVRKK